MIEPAVALDRTVLLLEDYVDDPAESVLATLSSMRVRIAADGATLASPTAQTALIATFQAVTRLGTEVILDIPGGVKAEPIPPLRGGDLFNALEQLASNLIRPLGRDGASDLRITLDRVTGADDIALEGSDFAACLRVGRDGRGWDGELPFGAMLAGAAAGAEVARLALRRLLPEDRLPKNPLAREPRDISIALPAFEYPTGAAVDLGQVDFVSAGAITHALLFALGQAPGLELYGRIFDDDVASEDNLNRYALLDATGLDIPKVDQLTALEWPTFDLKPIRRRIGDDELSESDGLADRVCAGVDSVRARWAIQRVSPGWLGIGATTHALAMASEHHPGRGCAGCLHPEAEAMSTRLPTISFVSLLGGTLLAHRLVRSCLVPTVESEASLVLDAFNLAADESVVVNPVRARNDCPVQCEASRSLPSSASIRRG